jgi:peptide/nickel transport system ATP-binding protein
MTTPVLEARAVTKHFPVHRRGRHVARGAVVHAVDGVSLALGDASITAIVGESGSGKSTLARTLARLILPTSGEVLLNGTPVRSGSRIEYTRTVQMVLQDPYSSLNPVHTIGYHLARPLKIHGAQAAQGMQGSLDARIASLLERVALSPAAQFTSKYPHELASSPGCCSPTSRCRCSTSRSGSAC